MSIINQIAKLFSDRNVSIDNSRDIISKRFSFKENESHYPTYFGDFSSHSEIGDIASSSEESQFDYSDINEIETLFDLESSNSSTNLDTDKELETEEINLNENLLNDKRLDFLRKKRTNSLIARILDEAVEFGFTTKAEEIITSEMNVNSLATMTWLNEIYIDNFSSSEILCGILRVISEFEYENIYPHGMNMALASLRHKNIEVIENGLRAFEKWGNDDSLEILKELDFTETWLQNYVNEIIEDIEGIDVIYS